MIEEQSVEGPQALPLRDARMSELLAYWHSLRGAAALPHYRDVDPLAIAPLLNHIWFWGYDRRLGRFVCRLAGDEVLRVLGPQKIVGRALDETMPAERAAWLNRLFLRVVETPAALHFSGRTHFEAGGILASERLVLPIFDNGESERAVMGLTVYGASYGDGCEQDYAGDEGVFTWAPLT